MSRPNHLNVPNTPEGIRRINEEQRHYDRDPEEYDRRERAEQERIDRERYESYNEEDYYPEE